MTVLGQELIGKPATYSAFCRKFGNHSSEKKGPRNWNEEAMKCMVNDLTSPMDRVIAFTASREARIVNSFLQTTLSAEEKLS